jgi:hypothetical protein
MEERQRVKIVDFVGPRSSRRRRSRRKLKENNAQIGSTPSSTLR